MVPRFLALSVASGTALAAALVATASPAQAATALAVDSPLAPGASLSSPSGAYHLDVQFDGNLVLYTAASRPLWSTRTAGHPVSRLVLQSDGNLVLYGTAGPLWYTGTRGTAAGSLEVQDDGNVVLYTAAKAPVWASGTRQASASSSSSSTTTPAPPPAPPAPTDRLAVGASLRSGTTLTSPSKAYALALTNGALVLTAGSQTVWTSPTAGSAATHADMQTDGNLVLYSAAGAVWSTRTDGSGATRLVVQDDGNLVVYTASGAPAWDSHTAGLGRPVTGDRLAAGQVLHAGDSLVAQGGRYHLDVQGDGNVVAYGPQGPMWNSNTRGWPGVRAALQTDGNFVVYSGGDVALFWTGTRDGANLVMQGDGNLVLYTPTGAATWSSWTSAPPPVVFAPVTAPPPTATSHYLRGLRGTAADQTTMRAMGCADARANPAGHRYITFLAFGAQSSAVAGGWGVQLTASTLRLTDAGVVAASNAYVDGYGDCMNPLSWLTVAVGTNNDGGADGLGGTGGQVWSQQVVNPIAAHAAGRQITVAGANDMEPGFNGSPDQARAWMSGYLATTAAPFVWTGSADGCPQSGGSNAACNFGWTPRLLFDLTYGASAGRSLPLPQIYYTSQARQWVNISQVGAAQWGRPAQYAGPLTELTACAQAQSCASMGAVDAWNTFWSLLSANPATRQTDLPYTTDIRIDS